MTEQNEYGSENEVDNDDDGQDTSAAQPVESGVEVAADAPEVGDADRVIGRRNPDLPTENPGNADNS